MEQDSYGGGTYKECVTVRVYAHSRHSGPRSILWVWNTLQEYLELGRKVEKFFVRKFSKNCMRKRDHGLLEEVTGSGTTVDGTLH